MSTKPEINIFWFRRDLRLTDNHGLFQALKSGVPVLPVFIFDKHILDKLEDPQDLRVQFIHQELDRINKELKNYGSGLSVVYSTPVEAFKDWLGKYQVKKVFTNRDYEQYAIQRDKEIGELLTANHISFETFKDQVIFEGSEVTKDDGLPYTVFTPYSRKWKATLLNHPLKAYPSEKHLVHFCKYQAAPIPDLASMGFRTIECTYPSREFPKTIIREYADMRNFPAVNGTTHFGIHLRFGTISIRALASFAQSISETYLNELIWRDFYHMILCHFPHVGRGESFRKEYDKIVWRNDTSDFEKWKKGQTGYPIVDAGMRELASTGFMHNRVRMIVASFLTKHLLIDWRWGEAWFAAKLLDFDFAANNGGWQWASGSGCDAAPYFRIFNPALQSQKFDKEGKYIRKWVPELDSLQYPQPMVVHEFARKRCLDTYAKYLGKSREAQK